MASGVLTPADRPLSSDTAPRIDNSHGRAEASCWKLQGSWDDAALITQRVIPGDKPNEQISENRASELKIGNNGRKYGNRGSLGITRD